MAVKEILKIGNDTLRKTSHPVEKFNLRLWLLLRDMADTMYKAEGVGLAGPQIGILRRVVVIDVQDDHGLIELVNPEIIAAEGEQGGPEGCLSVPGRQGFVYRPQKVTVRAQDRHGKVFELTGEDLLARAKSRMKARPAIIRCLKKRWVAWTFPKPRASWSILCAA